MQNQRMFVKPGTISTLSGNLIDLANPDTKTILSSDIAHGLSRNYRFGGHIHKDYTVAHHSLDCMYNCQATIKDPVMLLTILMHDASEGYLGDVPSPLKVMLPQYYVYEENLMRAIAKKFFFDWSSGMPEYVKQIDELALENEWNRFYKGINTPISNYEFYSLEWDIDKAKNKFIFEVGNLLSQILQRNP